MISWFMLGQFLRVQSLRLRGDTEVQANSVLSMSPDNKLSRVGTLRNTPSRPLPPFPPSNKGNDTRFVYSKQRAKGRVRGRER